MSVLKTQAPHEAANFRGTVLTAIEAATFGRQPRPAEAEMTREITEALDAA